MTFLDLLKCKVLNKLFKLEEALKLSNHVIEESKTQDRDLTYIDALITKADTLAHLGKIDESNKVISKTMDYVQHSPLNQSIEFIQREAILHIYMGSLHWLKGYSNEVLDNFQKGLELGTKIEDKFVIGVSISNIGAIYWRKGNLDQAYRFYEESLSNFKELKTKREIATVLGNLGEILKQKGNLKKALKYHKQSLENFKLFDNAWHISKEIFYLISVCIDLALKEKTFLKEATQYLQELEQISIKQNNKVINQRYRVAKALLLKRSLRTRDKGEAEIIFQEIIKEEIIDHDVTIVALLNLCDLLLLELRLSGDPEILLEVLSLVNRIFDIARKQHSYLLMADTYILKSKLALIQLDTKKAKKFLAQAQQICEEKGLKRLALSISNEYDLLLSQLTKWEEFIDRNAPLSERLEFTEFEKIVDQMLKKKMKELPDESKDDPVSLLILEDRGTTIFSKHFGLDNYSMADDQIIGGFLTAINSFMQNAFSSAGYLERIKHKDYTLILKTNSPFTFCYVFKGQSYSAMKKLNLFITQVKESDSIWGSFLRYVSSTILPAEPERKALETIAEKIFA